MQADLERAREALYCIPPDLPREDWVKAGMAAQAAGLGFEDFDSWSAQAGNYNERDARDTWRSFKPGKGIGAGSLFRVAAQYGYSTKPNDSTSSKARKAPDRQAKPQLKAPRPGNSPADVWARALPATELHPYIVRKGAAGVPLEGLRVLPDGDPLRIASNSMAGALVVPACGPGGAMQSLQLIPPDGPKMNLAGAPMAGARYIVGEVAPDVPLYLVEGIGAAWAVWQATGRAAVVCFGWGNVVRVAADLRQKGHALVLVPDTGKEVDADKIALEHGCAVAAMPEGWPPNSDVGDLAAQEGADVLAELLEAAKSPDAPEPLLKPVSVVDVQTNPSPPPRFVWDGYLPRGVVTLFGAHGGTGKSTVALMLAVAVALGRLLFGVPTKQSRVVFVSLEDSADIVRHRLAVICSAWGIDPRTLSDQLFVVDGTEYPELFTAESRGAGETTAAYGELRDLMKSTGAGLLIVDNASDAYGGDEILRRQVRAFVRTLAIMGRDNDAAVMLLSHVDKNTSRANKPENGEGYSGSTAWHNSVRSRLFMRRDASGDLILEHQKGNYSKGLTDPLRLVWLPHGLPDLAAAGGVTSELLQRMQARADDATAFELLRLIAEFESREQYCSPEQFARNNPFALLKSDPAFKALSISQEDTRRIVNQCQRAGWLASVTYRNRYRKEYQRWTVTDCGREVAGLPALTAPTAPTYGDDEVGAEGAEGARPPRPPARGVRGERARANDGAQDESEATS